MKIGVLALQGSVSEHLSMLGKCNAEAIEVKSKEELKEVNGLIIPGGESTTQGKLLLETGLGKEIRRKALNGMPVMGTCAGAILLAKKVTGLNYFNLGLMDIEAVRNGFGRQVDSFTRELNVNGIGRMKGVFIRAPKIRVNGSKAKILCRIGIEPVMLEQGNIIACSFHPELTENKKVHQYFLGKCKK
ncbi:MAG: pyridoxal 5'-phosphate synthase glutaminase subunit PdxT [archaeon]